MSKNKIMLVTGGAGFIGSNFIRYVLERHSDIEIVNLDLLTYAGSLNNLQHLPHEHHHHFVQGDICDENLLASLYEKYQFDTIVNFAAESHVDNSIANPKPFVQTNVIGTYCLLELARKHSLRFHHISTDEVYGSLSATDPTFSETTAYRPNSPYSASKAASDHLVRSYFKTYHLAATISNCSNNYGPYQHQEKFIPTIIASCLNQRKIPVYGDGSNIRDWLYVEDHCEAIWLILQNGCYGETYNVGADNELSNLQLVDAICHQFDELNLQQHSSKNLINFVKDRAGHDWRYGINYNKIFTELGWQPRTHFAEGLQKTLRFYVAQSATAAEKSL